MWKCLTTLLLIATPVLAQENPTAYDALRVVGNRFGRDAVNHVISVTGVGGSPQPETWHILIENPHSQGGVREIEVSNGGVTSEQERSVTGSGSTIKTSRLNLDSSGAYAVASHTADKSNTQFSKVSYTLRNGDHGDPVWIVTLQTRSSRPVGTIYIGANRGNVTRTEGMFAGATMNDVETERDYQRGTGGSHNNIISSTKERIEETFRHAQDEALDMFHRVRRSFVDFINDVAG